MHFAALAICRRLRLRRRVASVGEPAPVRRIVLGLLPSQLVDEVERCGRAAIRILRVGIAGDLE
jgi:hypothetical protein